MGLFHFILFALACQSTVGHSSRQLRRKKVRNEANDKTHLMQDISSRVQQAEPEIEVPDSEEFGDLLNVLVQEMMSYPTEPPSVTTRPPTKNPTMKPTERPTPAPTKAPTPQPTVNLGATTANPTAEPTTQASANPTQSPTASPSDAPTTKPSSPPTKAPSPSPSSFPTAEPSAVPSAAPSSRPTMNCNLTPEGREALITINLKKVSNPEDFDEPGTPQNLALEWILNEDTAYLCPQDESLVQRYVLAVFYYSTRGDRWRECSAPKDFSDPVSIALANAACTIQVEGGDSDAWLTPSAECAWGGLACDIQSEIIRIEMEQNGIGGTLPSELKFLQSLKFFLLEEGILTGIIPPELGDIRTLEQIDLNFNLLAGPLPDSLYTLTNLQQLDLNDNELTGSISPLIGQLTSLTFFQVDKNQLTGTIPTQMGSLVALEVATLDNNQMSGTMPAQVCANSASLEVLTADCLGAPNRPSPPLVVCSCCTECF